jgi:dihydroxy-acid dehydratase
MDPIRPSQVLTPAAFRNALVVLMALGGSTNAVVHLLAIAGRTRVPLSLDDFAAVSREVPLLVDCKPAGKGYMEDFDRAGGVPALLQALRRLLDPAALTATGARLRDLLSGWPAPPGWQSVIRTLKAPLGRAGALRVLRGCLAPDGALLKAAATTGARWKHVGPAAVFESAEDAAARIDDPRLELTPDHVLVLRNCGPVGAAMPEAGGLPIPRYLARQGVTDMVRISDARMSGTAFGTVVLHCAPEAAVGGPLAFVQDGDRIALDVERGRLDLLVNKRELARRQARWTPPPRPERGWTRLYCDHVQQANLGADFDFLLS